MKTICARARACVCVCVCVCARARACAHMLLVAVVGRPLPLLSLLLHVCDIGGCCCVLCSAGGRVSQVHRCLTPVLHALLLCVGVNAAWCLSQTSWTVQSGAATSLYHDSASPAAGPGLSGSHDNRGGSGEGVLPVLLSGVWVDGVVSRAGVSRCQKWKGPPFAPEAVLAQAACSPSPHGVEGAIQSRAPPPPAGH